MLLVFITPVNKDYQNTRQESTSSECTAIVIWRYSLDVNAHISPVVYPLKIQTSTASLTADFKAVIPGAGRGARYVVVERELPGSK